MRRALGVAALAVVLGGGSVAHAGLLSWMKPKTAAQVLADVQQTYAGASAISIGFDQTFVNGTFGTKDLRKGTLYLGKPDRFRFDYTGSKTPLKTAILYDGKDLWTVEPDKQQVTQTGVTPQNLPTAITFWNGASLARDFTIGFATKASPGAPAGATVLELLPKQVSAAYSRVYLVIDRSAATVAQSVVINSNSDVSTFTFAKANLAAKHAPSIFALDPAKLPKEWNVVRNPGK
ncbi:MAG: outer membrane lipoprotein carrier protein LolA [Deltaproteobacteria bacterium]|nr:outer membrane lipoprotein carrier protein LolA [Deltaproteobacteria bacterium]